MADFDELFNNVSASAMSELVNGSVVLSSLRDSKIKLVTELDSEHPLKAGEYYYSEDENTLYVGAGVIDSITLYITDFIQYYTSIRIIEPPRIKSKITFNLPSTSTYTNYNTKKPYRIYLNKIHTIPNIKTYTIANKTNKTDISNNHNITIPIISFESEVVKL